jgi:LPXTG-motif cell wall-anchored protein
VLASTPGPPITGTGGAAENPTLPLLLGAVLAALAAVAARRRRGA